MPLLVFLQVSEGRSWLGLPKPPQPQSRISCLSISVWSVESENRSLRNETAFLDDTIFTF